MAFVMAKKIIASSLIPRPCPTNIKYKANVITIQIMASHKNSSFWQKTRQIYVHLVFLILKNWIVNANCKLVNLFYALDFRPDNRDWITHSGIFSIFPNCHGIIEYEVLCDLQSFCSIGCPQSQTDVNNVTIVSVDNTTLWIRKIIEYFWVCIILLGSFVPCAVFLFLFSLSCDHSMKM